jgi:hypothetical protein
MKVIGGNLIRSRNKKAQQCFCNKVTTGDLIECETGGHLSGLCPYLQYGEGNINNGWMHRDCAILERLDVKADPFFCQKCLDIKNPKRIKLSDNNEASFAAVTSSSAVNSSAVAFPAVASPAAASSARLRASRNPNYSYNINDDNDNNDDDNDDDDDDNNNNNDDDNSSKKVSRRVKGGRKKKDMEAQSSARNPSSSTPATSAHPVNVPAPALLPTKGGTKGADKKVFPPKPPPVTPSPLPQTYRTSSIPALPFKKAGDDSKFGDRMLLLTLDRDRKLIQEEIHNCIIQFSLLVNLKEKNTVSSTISFLTASLERLLNQFEKAGGSRALDRLRRSDVLPGADVADVKIGMDIDSPEHHHQVSPNMVMSSPKNSVLSQPPMPIRGLKNAGNTCFMNAALQLLAVMVEPWIKDLVKHSEVLDNTTAHIHKTCVIRLLLHILKNRELSEKQAGVEI